MLYQKPYSIYLTGTIPKKMSVDLEHRTRAPGLIVTRLNSVPSNLRWSDSFDVYAIAPSS